MKNKILSVVVILAASALTGRAGEIGELGPHLTRFSGVQFEHIGEFHGNHAYISVGGDEESWGELQGGKYVASIIVVREDFMVICHNPKTGRFAMLNPRDPPENLEDVEFKKLEEESILAKGWKMVDGSADGITEIEKGNQQDWIYVDSFVSETEVERYYIGSELKTDPDSGFLVVPVLSVNEQKMDIFIDPSDRKVALVKTDCFWTPVEELRYRDMEKNGIGRAVWDYINTNNQ